MVPDQEDGDLDFYQVPAGLHSLCLDQASGQVPFNLPLWLQL